MKTYIKNICMTVFVSGLLFSPALVPSAQAAVSTNNPNELQMNFRDVPLETVLDYLSDRAGFIIMLDTRIGGNVTVVTKRVATLNSMMVNFASERGTDIENPVSGMVPPPGIELGSTV